MSDNIKILSIEATNYMALKNTKVDFALGDVFIVRAANGKGKTTLGESLFRLLQGKYPEKPLMKGESIGFFKATLEDGTVIKYQFDTDTQSLTLHDATGKKISDTSAREIIRRLIGDTKKSFDMDAFLRETAPAKQRAMIQQLAGVDLSEHDTAVKTARDLRTEINRKVEFQKPRVVGYDEAIAAKPLVNVAALLEQRNALAALNQQRNTLSQEINYKQQTEDRERYELLQSDKEVADLQVKLKAAQARWDAKQASIAAAVEAVKTAKLRLATAKPADPDEVLRIDHELTTASQTNAEINKHKAMQSDVTQLAQMQTQAKQADEKVKALEAARLEAIKAAQLPGGLQFDPNGEGLLLKGFPLSQSCSADLSICALQIKAQELGELGFVAFSGVFLDYANMQLVIDWLKENGLQAFIEKNAERAEEAELTVTVC